MQSYLAKVSCFFQNDHVDTSRSKVPWFLDFYGAVSCKRRENTELVMLQQ